MQYALQTFVQLHILLAATPALAGWTLLAPTTQVFPAHIAYLAGQNTTHANTTTAVSPQKASSARVTRRPALCRDFVRPVSFATGRSLTGQAATTATLPGRDYFSSYSPRAP